jgi:YegS/Rv2252/BmrU family lipid kinase
VTAETRDTVFIVPASKRDKLALDAIVDALGGADRVAVHHAADHAAVQHIAAEAAGTVAAVAIAGGDGSVRDVAGALSGSTTVLCVIPCGTANDFAKTIAAPLDHVAAAALRRTGQVQDVDIGDVNGHAFLNAAGCGLSTDVAHTLAGVRKRFGVLSYAGALLDVVRRRRSFAAEVTCDGQTIRLRTVQIKVGNGVRHGGGILVRDDASVDDGLLDLYAIPPLSTFRLMLKWPSLLRGTQYTWRYVTTLRGQRIELATPDGPEQLNVDGDILTQTPATFTVRRNALNVFVPAG